MGRGASDESQSLPLAPFSEGAWELLTGSLPEAEVSAATGATFDAIRAARHGVLAKEAWTGCASDADEAEILRDAYARHGLREAFASSNRHSAARDAAVFFAWQRGMAEEELLGATGWTLRELRAVIEQEAVSEAESLYRDPIG